MMIPFRALVRKDILLFFVDRRALLMSFAIPIAIGSFFGYVLGGRATRTRAKFRCWRWTRIAARFRAKSSTGCRGKRRSR